jgi:hypothetical protein
MNLAALAMALAGLLIWLFFSPHRHAEQGATLDRTRKLPSLRFAATGHFYQRTIMIHHVVNHQVGSFFGFQFFGCLLTTVF